MKLTFLGTRGGIIARSSVHYRHTSTLVSQGTTKILIDVGRDWLSKVKFIKADAIFITHAHSDHVDGLKYGAPCPVYATKETLDLISSFPLADCRVITPRVPVRVGLLTIESFLLEHSLHAPAVGYRITAGAKTVFYVPDVAVIRQPRAALKNSNLYVGDGAIMTRTMLVRRRGKQVIGHAPIVEQLAWCTKFNVPQAIFTHCGSEIVKGNPEAVARKVKALQQRWGIPFKIAHDGMVVIVR